MFFSQMVLFKSYVVPKMAVVFHVLVIMNCPLCPQCELPICASCSDELSRARPKMPLFALANEMWIGYINEYIYEHQVTYIELLCASPVNTAMLSVILQWFNDRVSGSSLAHLSNARLGTKGNVTCFSLPWEEIFQTFPKMVEGIIYLDWVKIWLASFKWLSKVTLTITRS